MGEISKYKLTFPVQRVDIAESYPYPLIKEEEGKAIIPAPAQIRVKEDELTFSIGQIRSRTPSVMYFKFYGFYYHENTPIIEYTSPRWVITTEYSLRSHTFNIKEILENTPQEVLNELGVKELTVSDLDKYYMELYTLGVDSENPLDMNHIMLAEGENIEYHQPNDAKQDVKIGFHNSYTANLYDNSDTYLQVIRPYRDEMTSTTITQSKTTILIPHLPNESTWDNPMNVFYEYMYQTEQRIGIEK